MRAIACAAVFALLALAAACGGGERGRDVTIVGGTAAQRALLGSIVDGLAPTRIRRITMRNVAVVGFPSKSWVEMSSEPPVEKDWVSLRARWEMSVLAGVFRDRSEEEGLPHIVYFGGGSVGRWRTDSTLSRAPASPAERIGIARSVAESASAQRAAVEKLDLLMPAGPALVLVLRVDDPAAFVKNRLPRILEPLWNSDRLEGADVLVRDRRGGFVFELEFSTRFQASGYDIRGDLRGCDPIIPIGVDVHAKPPPTCPAA